MRQLRTFIVDDNLEVARVHREYVTAADGFVVVGEAHTGKVALQEILELVPDVLLLDIYLPDISGLELLGELRAQGIQDLDVIAVTAARDLDSVRAAGSMGVRHYLVKPFPLSDLGDRLAEMRRYRQDLDNAAGGHELDQRRVDALLGSSAAPGRAAPMPKGLTAMSLSRVMDELRHPGGDSSATEIADRVGMSRVSARRYLEFLVQSGKAEVVQRYGTVGRPENRYRPSA